MGQEASKESLVKHIEEARAQVLAGAEQAYVTSARRGEELESRLSLIGLGKESTKTVVYGLLLADWEHLTWENKEQRQIEAGQSVEGVLNSIGDQGDVWADNPNDYTAIAVFKMPDGVHVAVKVFQEYCQLIPVGYSEDNLPDDPEPEFELVQDFMVVFCPPPEPLERYAIEKLFFDY